MIMRIKGDGGEGGSWVRLSRSCFGVIGAVFLVGALAGCPAEPSSSGASGTVVHRESHEYRNRPGRYYEVTVKERGGHRDTGRVSKQVYSRCTVGKSWPACKGK